MSGKITNGRAAVREGQRVYQASKGDSDAAIHDMDALMLSFKCVCFGVVERAGAQ